MQIGVAGRLVVIALTGLCVKGQQAPVQPAEVAADKPLLRMEVNLVQLDVTVTDSKDRHVSDLKASDFTVWQDGKPQKVTHFSFIPTPSRPQDQAPLPVGNYSRSRVLAQPPGARPKASEVRRTIAVVIDDLALSFANSQRVRDEVQAFIANDILPGDLVAVFRTSSGVSALQQFTTDRRILMASARQMRFQMLNRVGVDPLGVFQGDGSARDREPRASYARQDQIAVASIEALQHILGGIRALPGRKSLVVISEQLASRQLGAEGFVLSRRLGSLIDQANRSGVVVYTVDPQGGPPLVRGSEEMFPPLGGRLPSSTGILRRDPRYIDYGTAHDGLGLLAVQTGGRFLRGGNARERLRFAADDQLGYYLLGYAPEAGTFPADLAVQKFHRVKVRTKRSGLEVRSREGFFGLTDRVLVQEPETRAERLLAALYSPLRNNDIRLSLTSLFDVNGQTGPAVLSMLHVDARDLKFEEQADGSKQAQIDLVTAAYDYEGRVADVQTRTLRLRVPAAEYENSLRRGLILSAQHPIRHSGPFQFRVSVADAGSDRVGAASQFVEVPDLVKGGLAMSGILLMGENAAGTAAGDATTGYTDGHAAIRRFQPGDRLRYQYKVLNANAKDGPAELESALLLYRDGVEVFRSQPRAVSTQGAADASRLLLGGDLKLPASFTPGDYALQLMVRDRRAPKGKEVAASSVDFELTGAEEAGR